MQVTSGSCYASGRPLTLTMWESSLSVLSKAKARCWMRCLGQSCMRKLVNFLSSTPSHFISFVEVTPPSSSTLSGSLKAPSGVVSITSDTAKVASSEVRLAPLVYFLYCSFAVGVPKLSARYFSMSASAAFSLGSLMTDMSVGRFCACCSVGSGCSLAAEDVFYTRDEVVECCHFLEFLLLVLELSSLIFSSRRCFWSRARAVSCTRSS